MALISDALRQAFMPKREYECLREEDKAWTKLQRPLLISTLGITCLVIFVSTTVSFKIVFPGDNGKRPFCSGNRLQPLPLKKNGGDSDLFPGAFYLTDQETVDYYWMVVFVPSVIVFLASLAYLVAGMNVAYSAPARHGCLKVVENNYCASKRGGVRCLSILNGVFAIIFGLLALFLGSSLLTLGSSCSLPLFHLFGFLVCVGSTAGRALKSVVQGILLTSEAEKLHSMNLLLYMAPMAALILLPFTLYIEGNVAAITIEKARGDPFIVLLLAGHALVGALIPEYDPVTLLKLCFGLSWQCRIKVSGWAVIGLCLGSLGGCIWAVLEVVCGLHLGCL